MRELHVRFTINFGDDFKFTVGSAMATGLETVGAPFFLTSICSAAQKQFQHVDIHEECVRILSHEAWRILVRDSGYDNIDVFSEIFRKMSTSFTDMSADEVEGRLKSAFRSVNHFRLDGDAFNEVEAADIEDYKSLLLSAAIYSKLIRNDMIRTTTDPEDVVNNEVDFFDLVSPAQKNMILANISLIKAMDLGRAGTLDAILSGEGDDERD